MSRREPIEVFKQREILAKSPMQTPWILEVFERFHGTNVADQKYPRSKDELFKIIESSQMATI